MSESILYWHIIVQTYLWHSSIIMEYVIPSGKNACCQWITWCDNLLNSVLLWLQQTDSDLWKAQQRPYKCSAHYYKIVNSPSVYITRQFYGLCVQISLFILPLQYLSITSRILPVLFSFSSERMSFVACKSVRDIDCYWTLPNHDLTVYAPYLFIQPGPDVLFDLP